MTIRGTIQGKRFGRTRFALAVGAAIVALATAQAAQAYEAYVTQAAPILTGPSADYPAVVYLRGGEPVEVYGCLPDYDWCDISFRDYRGWFDANLLAYPYQGRRVPLYDYGYDIGLPIIGFSLGDYWGRYYRDRPFFRERERWAHIPLSPPREDHRRFDGRPGFDRQGGRPDFDRDHGPRQGRPDFDRDHGPQQGRPDFDRDHGPQQGRPDFGRDHGPQQGRPDFGRDHGPQQGRPDNDRGPGRADFNRGPQFEQQQQQQRMQDAQRAGQEQQQRLQEQQRVMQQQQQRVQEPPRPQMPAPQVQAPHMQGPPEHQRYVGPGQAPQPHPQAAPPAPPPAPPSAAAPQGHPEGGHPGGARGDHNQDNK